DPRMHFRCVSENDAAEGQLLIAGSQAVKHLDDSSLSPEYMSLRCLIQPKLLSAAVDVN
ncbi:hypothetical protein ACO22_08042, partial [Paracoccidioides brasiliensis]